MTESKDVLNYVADMTYCGADAKWHFKDAYDPQRVLDALTHPEAQGNKDFGEPAASGLEEERLAEIEARLRAASPGPWHACGVHTEKEVLTGVSGDAIESRKHKNGACSCGFVWCVPADVPVLEVTGGTWGDRYPAIRRNEDGTLEPFLDGIDYGKVPHEIQAANMKFIASAPTDVADLLAEVSRLRLLLQASAKHEAAPTNETDEELPGSLMK